MFDPKKLSKIVRGLKGERTVHRLTFNPSSANPGDTLRVELPSLSNDMVLFPKSLKLRFNLEVEQETATNHQVFNVSRNLVDNFSVKFGSYKISDIERYDLYEGYHDLLKIDEDLLTGITSEDKRKIRAGATGASTNIKLVKHCGRYGTMYNIPLSHPILDDHGCFNSRGLKDKLEFEIRLAKKGDIVITTDLSKNHSFKLNNIELEYTTMKNKKLADNVSDIYEAGKSFFFEDIHLFKKIPTIDFSSQKVLRTNINMSSKFMKGVLFLFNKTYVAGARDTEEFINPLISSVDVTINGVSHSLYADGIKPTDEWENILKKCEKRYGFKEVDFQNDKYALWIDLRAEQDNILHGDGKNFGENGENLIITITSESTETSVNCHIFVVSDAKIDVEGGKVTKYVK